MRGSKEELRSLHVMFERQKEEAEKRMAMLQEHVTRSDEERRQEELLVATLPDDLQDVRKSDMAGRGESSSC